MTIGRWRTWNCEPIAPALDAVLLGDGEEGLVEMCSCVRDAREDGVSRSEILLRLSRIPGVYVPSLYEIVVDESSTRWGYAIPRKATGAPEVILKRCLPDLSATEPVPQRIVPYLGIVQDREVVEVLRGCARGCRFCQAGMAGTATTSCSGSRLAPSCASSIPRRRPPSSR